MILKGSLNIVTDAQMAVQASASSRVLFVGELKDKNPANFINKRHDYSYNLIAVGQLPFCVFNGKNAARIIFII